MGIRDQGLKAVGLPLRLRASARIFLLYKREFDRIKKPYPNLIYIGINKHSLQEKGGVASERGSHSPFFTALCSLLSALCSLLLAHCSLLSALCSLLFALCSLLIAHCSLLFTLCSLLIAHCSLLSALCSLLFPRVDKSAWGVVTST
jgi:hypothetical protein